MGGRSKLSQIKTHIAMNSLTDQAAQVLAEIDAELAICEKATAGPWEAGAESGMAFLSARDRCIPGVSDIGLYADDTTTSEGLRNLGFIAASRTVCPKSLRCLKTAIEGLSPAYNALPAGRAWLPWEIGVADKLTTLINQWNENK